MAQICNKVEELAQKPKQRADDTIGDWESVYRENERFVESGSAYFSQAFAEALGLVSDIELHDVERARVRLEAVSMLLDYAIQQYTTSVDVDDRTGLQQFHESRLRDIGLDYEGTVRTLQVARAQGYIVASDDIIESISRTFSEQGYRALAERFIRKVRDIRGLATDATTEVDENTTGAIWQGIAWRLTSAFAHAMEFGQSMAVMNSAAYR